jgi:hypothetical protein
MLCEAQNLRPDSYRDKDFCNEAEMERHSSAAADK